MSGQKKAKAQKALREKVACEACGRLVFPRERRVVKLESAPKPLALCKPCREPMVCGAIGAGVNEGLGPCQLKPGHEDVRHKDHLGRGFVTFKAGTAAGRKP